MVRTTLDTTVEIPVHFAALVASFRRSLAAENQSPNTFDVYVRSAVQLGVFQVEAIPDRCARHWWDSCMMTLPLKLVCCV
jgi:hypothetical protein